MSYILFSPIGMTDPVRDCYDGPLLHILRHYDVRKAYLFLTAAICRLQPEEDGLYNQYAHAVSPGTEIVLLRHEEIVDPSDFDCFFAPYAQALNRIREENPGCRTLVNCSSGTPQGIATLCMLLGGEPQRMYQAIQVVTPKKDANRDTVHLDIRREPLSLVMANNIDHAPSERSENRCRELRLQGVAQSMVTDDVRRLIQAFDFVNAHRTANRHAAFFEPSYLRLLEAASLRAQGRTEDAENLFGEGADALFADGRGPENALLEKYLATRNRLVRRDLEDFFLRVSPVFTALAERVLRARCGFDVNRCVRVSDNVDLLDPEKLRDAYPDLAAWLERREPRLMSRPGYIKLYTLLRFLRHYEETGAISKKTMADFTWLRNVEERARNTLAHALSGMGEQGMLACCGVLTPEALLTKLDGVVCRCLSDESGAPLTPRDIAARYPRMRDLLLSASGQG